jgi:hypothetical protein
MGMVCSVAAGSVGAGENGVVGAGEAGLGDSDSVDAGDTGASGVTSLAPRAPIVVPASPDEGTSGTRPVGSLPLSAIASVGGFIGSGVSGLTADSSGEESGSGCLLGSVMRALLLRREGYLDV